MKKGDCFTKSSPFLFFYQKGVESIAATNQTENMACSREMDLAVSADWFADGGSLGAAFDF